MRQSGPLEPDRILRNATIVTADADFAIVDLKAKRTITNDWIASKCGWTPYDGKQVTGWVMATLVRGNIVMRDDELVGKASGAPVKFVETL